jgi:hypothetical protein
MRAKLHRVLLLSSLLALAGCVTINIYFPAAAAEKAADKIIDEVWRMQKPESGDRQSDKGAVPQEQKP